MLLLFTLPRCWVGREVLSSTLSRSGGSIGLPRYNLWGEHRVRGAPAWSGGRKNTSGGNAGAAPWGQASRAHLDQALQTSPGVQDSDPSSSLLESQAVPRGGCCGERAGKGLLAASQTSRTVGAPRTPYKGRTALCNSHGTPTHTQQPPAGTLSSLLPGPEASGYTPRSGWAGDILLPHCQGRGHRPASSSPSPLCRLSGSGT